MSKTVTFSGCAERRRGFTLVELLVVLAIIAILISLLLSAVYAYRNRQRQVMTDATQHALLNALRNYRVEYRRWPVNPDAGGIWVSNNYVVMSWLMPDHAQNTRRLLFWDNSNHAIKPVLDGYGASYSIQIDVANNEVTVSSANATVPALSY